MNVVTIISEVLLYTSFSLLFGFYILNLVPQSKRPQLSFPKWLRISSIIGIAAFSFVPILILAEYIAGSLSEIGNTLPSILLSFDVGKSWIYTAVLSLLLLIQNFVPDIEKKKPLLFLSLVYLLGLVFLVGWSSHSSSLTGISGLLLHSMHFLAISLWTGILLVIGWFSKGNNSWLLPFLKWFTPVAIACVALGIFTGVSMMTVVVGLKEYPQSWLVPYGQTLLFKHLLIIPLLVFAFLNGVLIKRLIKTGNEINVFSWLRAEGMFIFLIYFVTGILGSVAPPHNIPAILASEGPSWLLETVLSGEVDPSMKVNLVFQAPFILLALLAVGCLVLMVILFLRKKSSYLAVLFGSLFVITSYLSLMLSIS